MILFKSTKLKPQIAYSLLIHQSSEVLVQLPIINNVIYEWSESGDDTVNVRYSKPEYLIYFVYKNLVSKWMFFFLYN